MSKYAFLFIDDGVDYQGDPTPEQQKTYADIFRWFETNGPMIVDGVESVGGFSIIEVPDREAAIALAKTWPGYGIEIRDVVEQRERAEV